jgi:hypothetical protein
MDNISIRDNSYDRVLLNGDEYLMKAHGIVVIAYRD